MQIPFTVYKPRKRWELYKRGDFLYKKSIVFNYAF